MTSNMNGHDSCNNISIFSKKGQSQVKQTSYLVDLPRPNHSKFFRRG
jgi:hypothetical protein